MQAYLITYDLRKQGQDYSGLYAALQEYRNLFKISNSCWAIKTDLSPEQVLNDLCDHLDGNDTMFICPINPNSFAAHNIPEKLNLWLASLPI